MMVRHWVLLAMAVIAMPGFAEDGSQTAPEESGDMQRLFNGEDLSGWDGDPQLWSVRDGVIHGETTEENRANGNTFLICEQTRTKDFELRLSFRSSATNNSGIQYRSRHITEGNPRNKWVVRGYQHEVRNEENLPNVAGFIYDEGGGRGRICLVGEKAVWEAGEGKQVIEDDLVTAEEFKELFRLDDWNDVVIVAKDNRIRHYLNGRLILDFTDDPELALLDGILALQLHAGAPMWVEFNDIRIKSL